jgi:hypothetical protein
MAVAFPTFCVSQSCGRILAPVDAATLQATAATSCRIAPSPTTLFVRSCVHKIWRMFYCCDNMYRLNESGAGSTAQTGLGLDHQRELSVLTPFVLAACDRLALVVQHVSLRVPLTHGLQRISGAPERDSGRALGEGHWTCGCEKWFVSCFSPIYVAPHDQPHAHIVRSHAPLRLNARHVRLLLLQPSGTACASQHFAWRERVQQDAANLTWLLIQTRLRFRRHLVGYTARKPREQTVPCNPV